MKVRYITTTVAALALAASAAVAIAATTTNPDHVGHHPAAATSAAATSDAATSDAGATTAQRLDNMRQMGKQQKSMHELHQKFMAATTPEERNALMPEHMKAMQQAMDMMQGMSGMHMMDDMKTDAIKMKMPSDMTLHHQMMEQRMEMMQTMMQMMLDRLPGATEK